MLQIGEAVKHKTAGGRIAFAVPAVELPVIGRKLGQKADLNSSLVHGKFWMWVFYLVLKDCFTRLRWTRGGQDR